MLPVLFHVPGLGYPLHSYGVLIVTGFVLALFVTFRQARKIGADEELHEHTLDFAFWALLGGFIGARLVFIFVNWEDYTVHHPYVPLDFGPIHIKEFPALLAVWRGGLVFYGAAIGGFLSFMMFAHKRGLPKLKLADAIIVGLPLAHVFGRFGCVAAGCCWGEASYHVSNAGKVIADLPITMRFPPGSLAYQSLIRSSDAKVQALMNELGTTVPLVPTQLMESFGEGIIFLILMFVASRKWFHGQVLLTYGILYPILRSSIELFRGDAERGYVIDGVLSTSQFISLLVALSSLITIIVLKQRQAREL